MYRLFAVVVLLAALDRSAVAALAVPSGSAIRDRVQGASVAAASPARRSVGAGSAHARSDTARVRLGADAGATWAFVAWPAGDDPVPSMVVVQEWWGLNGQIRDVARRLAREGYVAIVPDLYHGKVATDPERAHELSRSLDDQRAVADLHAAARWLRAQPRSRSTRMGVLGFCMGGGLAEEFALDTSNVSAAVVFYGSPITDSTRLAHLNAPLQAHFGADDQGISLVRVGDFKSALSRAGKPAEIYIYPAAGHAFMNETKPSYRADAARQAWVRTLAFLQRYLKT